MSSLSSNMISKRYCPECGGFDLVKLHRGFIQKRILRAPNNLQCLSCGYILSVEQFNDNTPKDVPMFIDSSLKSTDDSSSTEQETKPVDTTIEDAVAQLDNDPTHADTPPMRWPYYLLGLGLIAAAAYFVLYSPSTETSTTIAPAEVIPDLVPDTPTPQEESYLITPTLNSTVSLDSSLQETEQPPVTAPTVAEQTHQTNPDHTDRLIADTSEPAMQSSVPLEAALQDQNSQIQQIEAAMKDTTPVIEDTPASDIEVPALSTHIQIEVTEKNTIPAIASNSPAALDSPDPSDELIEKAAIELMKNDLDRLFQ